MKFKQKAKEKVRQTQKTKKRERKTIRNKTKINNKKFPFIFVFTILLKLIDMNDKTQNFVEDDAAAAENEIVSVSSQTSVNKQFE